MQIDHPHKTNEYWLNCLDSHTSVRIYHKIHLDGGVFLQRSTIQNPSLVDNQSPQKQDREAESFAATFFSVLILIPVFLLHQDRDNKFHHFSHQS